MLTYNTVPLTLNLNALRTTLEMSATEFGEHLGVTRQWVNLYEYQKFDSTSKTRWISKSMYMAIVCLMHELWEAGEIKNDWIPTIERCFYSYKRLKVITMVVTDEC